MCDHPLGLPSRLASHALLHPTGKPVESKGPMRGAGPKYRINHFRSRGDKSARTVWAEIDWAVSDTAIDSVRDSEGQVVSIDEGN